MSTFVPKVGEIVDAYDPHLREWVSATVVRIVPYRDQPGYDLHYAAGGSGWNHQVRRALIALTDEQLADEIREQVNLSRFSSLGHNRERTRNLSAEAARRGWNPRRPSTSCTSSKP